MTVFGSAEWRVADISMRLSECLVFCKNTNRITNMGYMHCSYKSATNKSLNETNVQQSGEEWPPRLEE